MNELDEIMSDDSNVVPEIQQEQPVQEGPVRDDHGRFAPKQETAAVEQPVIEHQAVEHQPGGVPVAALQAERDKARSARDEAETLRREIAELRGMVTAQRQPAPQPQQEQQPASLWDDPEAYLRSQMNPLEQRIAAQAANFSMRMAVKEHGREVFDAAEQALSQVASTPEGNQIISKLRASDDPAEELIQWHKQQQAIARVGNDPDAWLNAEIEKRMNDPNFLAQAMERARASATSNVNRSQTPMTSIPPSLSRIPSGANAAADNDMSDGAIFSHAMR